MLPPLTFADSLAAVITLIATVVSVEEGSGSFEPGGNATVGHIRMYYEIHGEGKPLLLIMGLGGHILDWGWVLPEKLAESHRVIAFDNRGSGRSDQPSGPMAEA